MLLAERVNTVEDGAGAVVNDNSESGPVGLEVSEAPPRRLRCRCHQLQWPRFVDCSES